MSSLSQDVPSISFAEAVAHRRSVYGLKASLPSGLTDAKLQSLVKDAALQVPSAFNSQTTRLVLLVKGEHEKFWQSTSDIFKSKQDEETFKKTGQKLAGFKGAYGSILFFEDSAVIKKMQERTPAYANLFPEWSEHTSAMHQFALWVALEAFKGVGANLQHFHFDREVAKMAIETWELPEEWQLKAQLVFGEVADGAFPTEGKPKEPTEQTVKVFGV